MGTRCPRNGRAKKGVAELEKRFAFGWVVFELSAVCAAHATALHRHEHRRLLRPVTLSRRANAEQQCPKELRRTSVDDHAGQESLKVKSCPKAIVAASPRRVGRLFPESELLSEFVR